MENVTQRERLVAVETNLINLDKKVTDGFSEVKSGVKSLTDKLEAVLPTFVTEDRLFNTVKELRQEIINTKSSRLKDLIIQALVIGPISALIGYFFATVTK